MPQKSAVLQVRIEERDKARAERLYDAMGTSLSEAVRMFIKQSILARRLPFQPVSARAKSGYDAYGALRAYGHPNHRSSERSSWIEYLSVLREDRDVDGERTGL